MGEVAKLKLVKPKGEQGVIDMLRGLLRDAEAGKILQLVVVGELSTGGEMVLGRSRAAGASYLSLIGGLEHMKQKLIAEQLSDE
ncbi:MAG TPA: hypothetical protein VFT22_10955 [Kofleriaceae bacterium]|nr:hypothetical protein [Kofleriaceae bacterium]